MSGPPGNEELRGRALVGGTAGGSAVVLEEPLSLWGGMDVHTGRLVDPRHPQFGAELGGHVLVMSSGRGSSSSSSVLAESIRLGTSPSAVILQTPDPILVLGSIVGTELYGRIVPVVALDHDGYASIRTGDAVRIETEGRTAVVRIVRSGVVRH